jgi:lipopolysaccharide transport system ATP-binding protein
MRGAINVQGVSRAYRRYNADRPWTWQEVLVRGWRRLWPAETFWALREVSFTIAPGRMVGVIGHNGAGKSTLLRLMGGVGQPDAGRIEVHGRLGALLELGAGFHPELTGRENAIINGVISGLTKAEVARQFDSIVSFAELEDFIDSPLRTYSSGMIMRLAFAVAAHIEPEVLLIDEVLGVGDLAFQEKCLQRIEEFKSSGCTILLVSHNTDEVEQLCDEALWLRGGRLVAHGPAREVVKGYVNEMTHLEAHLHLPDPPDVALSVGTQ